MQYRSGSPTRALGLCESDDSAQGDSSLSDDEVEDDEVEVSGLLQTVSGPPPVIRPGIVHRLDKGTSGLLVVAKDDYSHAQLCEQFKARSVSRTYVSLSCGVPSVTSGRIEVPIARDVRDRKRMAAVVKSAGSRTARLAASRYRVLEVLGQGGCTLIEWKLETGRTHQIRVHAQHLGHPVLGDEQYGGTEGAVLSRLTARLPPSKHSKARQLVSRIERPCLHALTIGFKHPWTGLQHNFTRGPPQDFENTWLALQQLGGRSLE